MLQLSPWSDLRDMRIINSDFCFAYTLKTYDELWGAFMDRLCEMVVESGKMLAGQKADDDAELVQHLVELILKRGVWFWGIKTHSTGAKIRSGCERMLKNELVLGMSQISVQDS